MARTVSPTGEITVLFATALAPAMAATSSLITECVAPVSSSMMNGPLPFTITGTITPP